MRLIFTSLSFLLVAGSLFATEEVCVRSTDKAVVDAQILDAGKTFSQSLSIRVDNLATNENWQAPFTNIKDQVTSVLASLTITYRGKTTFIRVMPGTELRGLARLIHHYLPALSVQVYDTGAGGAKPIRLSITDTQSGKFAEDQSPGVNYNLSFSSALTELSTADFGSAPVIEGMDSKVYLNGNSAEPIYRDTNILEDVIPGLKLMLWTADPTTFKTLTISHDCQQCE